MVCPVGVESGGVIRNVRVDGGERCVPTPSLRGEYQGWHGGLFFQRFCVFGRSLGFFVETRYSDHVGSVAHWVQYGALGRVVRVATRRDAATGAGFNYAITRSVIDVGARGIKVNSQVRHRTNGSPCPRPWPSMDFGSIDVHYHRSSAQHWPYTIGNDVRF